MFILQIAIGTIAITINIAAVQAQIAIGIIPWQIVIGIIHHPIITIGTQIILLPIKMKIEIGIKIKIRIGMEGIIIQDIQLIHSRKTTRETKVAQIAMAIISRDKMNPRDKIIMR